MDRAVFARMEQVEGAHWWFAGRRAVLRAVIARLVRPPRGARILEAGCGSGESKWPARRLWRLALDGITSSTTAPLRIWSYLGVVVALLAIGYAAFLVVYTLAFGADAPGYASIMVAVLGLGALNLLSMGILGEYVGRIAIEVRRRPLYVVESRVGF